MCDTTVVPCQIQNDCDGSSRRHKPTLSVKFVVVSNFSAENIISTDLPDVMKK